MNKLAGKSAVVTGASQGIGKEIAWLLHNMGVELHLVGRSASRLEESAGGFGDTTYLLHEADLSKQRDLQLLAKEVAKRREKLDILIHCGGQYARGAWAVEPVDTLERLINTNVYGPIHLTRSLLPLLQNARGDIVFVNSSIVNSAAADTGHYAVTKHALRAMADSLRAEINNTGVRVLSVFPGRTATPLQKAVHDHEQKRYVPDRLLQPVDVAEAIIACLSLGETAEVTDLHIRPRFGA